MSAMEKVAWFEFSLSLVVIALATALVPWLGHAAAGTFGLLGFLACGIWFLRSHGKRVIVDERDREIERKAKELGVGVAWFALLLGVIAIGFWSSYANDGIVKTAFLTWLVWIQFAICYAVKGLVGIILYRRQRHAAQ